MRNVCRELDRVFHVDVGPDLEKPVAAPPSVNANPYGRAFRALCQICID